MPCFKALNLAFDLPSAVVGPVDFWGVAAVCLDLLLGGHGGVLLLEIKKAEAPVQGDSTFDSIIGVASKSAWPLYSATSSVLSVYRNMGLV